MRTAESCICVNTEINVFVYSKKMKDLVMILAVLSTSWYFTDLGSENPLTSVLAPIGFIFSLIALGLWLVFNAGLGARTSSADIDGSGAGGDGGGCD